MRRFFAVAAMSASSFMVIRPWHTGQAFAFAGEQEYERAATKAAEEQLAAAVKNIPAELKSQTGIGTGDAADEIVRIAKMEAADLVVISTHGLTGWRHLVFGSVAEKVIRLSERNLSMTLRHLPA